MQARDLMKTDVLTVIDTDSVTGLLDVFVRKRIHGAPVVDGEGRLVGMVTQQDAFFAAATQSGRPTGAGTGAPAPLKVADIMTAPAVTASEETDVRSLCRMMAQLGIHRLPIVRDGRVTGIVSSLDICEAVAEGKDF